MFSGKVPTWSSSLADILPLSVPNHDEEHALSTSSFSVYTYRIACVSEMTYYVSSGTLNPTHSLHLLDQSVISEMLGMSDLSFAKKSQLMSSKADESWSKYCEEGRREVK